MCKKIVGPLNVVKIRFETGPARPENISSILLSPPTRIKRIDRSKINRGMCDTLSKKLYTKVHLFATSAKPEETKGKAWRGCEA